MNRSAYLLAFVWVALAACALSDEAPNVFPAPANALPMEDTGALLGYQPGYVQVRDSHMGTWLLQIVPETTITIEGQADAAYLRPGQSVQFEGHVDDNLVLEGPIKEIEIYTPSGKSMTGLYPLGESGAADRPIKKPAAGNYLIKGKVTSSKEGKLVVAVGRGRVTGDLDDKTEVKFTSEDPAVAALGDSVKFKAWYLDNTKPMPLNNVLGRGIVEEITITLTDPPAPIGKRARTSQRPAKATFKSAKEDAKDER